MNHTDPERCEGLIPSGALRYTLTHRPLGELPVGALFLRRPLHQITEDLGQAGVLMGLGRRAGAPLCSGIHRGNFACDPPGPGEPTLLPGLGPHVERLHAGWSHDR